MVEGFWFAPCVHAGLGLADKVECYEGMTKASRLGIMLASSFQASNLMPDAAAAVTALLGNAQYLRWADG